MRPPNIFTRGWLLTVSFVPQLFHDTKSIFCHQVQYFYFFVPPEVRDSKHEVDEGYKALNNLVTLLQ